MSALGSPSGADAIPSRSQIEQWDSAHLDAAAARWRTAATESDEAFERHRQNIAAPGGSDWTGHAKDAAWERVTTDVAVVRSHGDVQREAAGIAENGSDDLRAAQQHVLDAIADAEEDGFTVGEDLSVTDTRRVDILTMASRQTAAREHAEFIQWRAGQLVQTDNLIGDQLAAKATDLISLQFEGDGTDDGSDGNVYLVDNKIKLNPQDQPAEDRKDEPGDKPAEQAPGQIGPFPVPKAVEDAANNPEAKPEDKPATTSDVGGDLGDLLGAEDTQEGKPEDGQPAQPDDAKPGALPEALGNVQPPIRPQDNPRAASPTVDPNSPEGKKIEAARQSLEASGMPPAEVQRTLDNVFGGAQEPYIPPQGDPMPKPGFGDGVGDAWHATEDGVHDLTGQNGFENFKDAWKDLGSSVVETVKDPYGTLVRGIGEEFEHATQNPTHWLGEKAFQAGTTAATAPFGGEGALARGALDDVPRPGVPHEVIDGPDAGHHSSPVPEHSAPLPPAGPVDHVPTNSNGLLADVFDPNAGINYGSGDPHFPGRWPPDTPAETWVPGQTDQGWKYFNRGSSEWVDYQLDAGGLERTPDGRVPEYMQVDPNTGKPVAFDSHLFRGEQEVFIDAKAGREGMFWQPDNEYWVKRAATDLATAERQLSALPPGAKLEWHVSTPEGAAALRNMLDENFIYDITVVYTPRP